MYWVTYEGSNPSNPIYFLIFLKGIWLNGRVVALQVIGYEFESHSLQKLYMSKRKFKNDGNKRFFFENNELKCLAIKFFKKNQNLTKKNVLISKILSSKIKPLYRFKNRCVLTSRSRGVVSKYNISRIMFRKLFSKGFLPDYRKSSW